MSEARPYKRPEREKVLESENEKLAAELEREETPRPDIVPPPKTESKPQPKKQDDEDKDEDENKETLDDVKRDDRYRASSGS